VCVCVCWFVCLRSFVGVVCVCVCVCVYVCASVCVCVCVCVCSANVPLHSCMSLTHAESVVVRSCSYCGTSDALKSCGVAFYKIMYPPGRTESCGLDIWPIVRYTFFFFFFFFQFCFARQLSGVTDHSSRVTFFFCFFFSICLYTCVVCGLLYLLVDSFLTLHCHGCLRSVRIHR
jgi:hypothetical protein